MRIQNQSFFYILFVIIFIGVLFVGQKVKLHQPRIESNLVPVVPEVPAETVIPLNEVEMVSNVVQTPPVLSPQPTNNIDEEPVEENAVVEPLLPKTYYVNLSGNDQNDGISEQTAWQTIDRVNQGIYNPGDKILFQGGQSFEGSLQFDHLNLLGTLELPVVISSYGNSRAVIQSRQASGLYVHNVSGITVSNLNFSGPGAQSSEKTYGLSFYNASASVLFGIDINNVEVSGYQSGIYFSAEFGSAYQKVSIKNISVHDNVSAGVEMRGLGYGNGSNLPVGLLDIYLGANHIFNNKGSDDVHLGAGVVIDGAEDVVLENNTVHDNGGTGNVFAVNIHGDRVTVQNNEIYNQRVSVKNLTGGGGLALRGINNLVQFNYFHNNDGSAFLLSGNQGLTLRYNVSENDSLKTKEAVVFVSDASACHIFNNTFYSSLGQFKDRPLISLSKGASEKETLNDVYFRNNIFVVDGIPMVAVDNPDSLGVKLENNNYFDLSGQYSVLWGKDKFNKIKTWSRATSQEMNVGKAVWFVGDPQFCSPGMGATKYPNPLKSLTAYRLQETSPLLNRGWDLYNSFGVRMGEQDFSGNHNLEGKNYDPGAFEFIPGQSCLY